jgi:hypothetical protein
MPQNKAHILWEKTHFVFKQVEIPRNLFIISGVLEEGYSWLSQN